MCADRRREPLANTGEDYLAACGPGLDLGGHFRVYAVLERVYLRVDVHLFIGSENGAGWSRYRIGRRRRLPLGLADGGRVVRLASRCGALFALRRVLRLRFDGSRQRMTTAV